MAKFGYVISDKTGKKVEGTLRAADRSMALQQLQEKGGIVLSLTENYVGASWFMGKPNLSLAEKLLLIGNLATMVKIGMTLVESFEIIKGQTKKAAQIKMYNDIIDRLRTGESLADALRNYKGIFSELFINMVETGERSGNLAEALEYLNIQLNKEYELRKKIVGALIYPAVIISLTLLLAVGIVIFIMPKITAVFKSFDVTLPLPTRFLIGMSDFFSDHTILALVLTFSFFFSMFIIFRIKALKPMWDALALRVPIFGKIFIAGNVARFARSMNSLVQAGIAVNDALRIVANMTTNLVYQKYISQAGDKVDQGGKLGVSFSENLRLFPVLVGKMLQIGETTGTLEITLGRIAELYEKEVDGKTKNLSTLLEPLLLVMMSALVGGIALSIILPIYQLPNLIG